MSQGLPRSVRLTNANDYTEVFRCAKITLSNRPLRTRAIQNRMPSARLGVVVPKRNTAKAVHRNRIKRIVREYFRCRLAKLPCVDIVIQVFDGTDEKKLRQSLDLHLQRIKEQLGE
ncbi:MAG: ribonuclease P protein component [Gammaproteobacteria bacterium]|nr:ribonuclease P protein component [Gammaproteobacteria bacterium]